MKPWAALALALALGPAPSGAAQVCDTQSRPLSSPSDRFVDHGDGTLTDTAAQLMWMRCSNGQSWVGGRCSGPVQSLGWLQAVAAADQTNAAGTAFFNDWRLPTLRELAMLAERQCRDPRINLELFPGTPAAAYWSSTRRPGSGANGPSLTLDFGPDGVSAASATARHHVRLVRHAR